MLPSLTRPMTALAAASALMLTACSDDGGPEAMNTCAASEATPGPATVEPVSQVPTATVQTAVTATEAFLATLDEAQTEAVQFEFTDLDAKRCSWSNFPKVGFGGRHGVRMGDLTQTQQDAAVAVIQSVLSDSGFEQVQGIRTADDALSAAEGGSDNFSSGEYWLALYGEPSTSAPWTVQFGGHHLAVHVSLGPETLSASPNFVGVEPLSFTYEGTEYAPMQAEGDAIFGLFGSLTDEQRASAELSGSFDDIVMGPGVDTEYPESVGLLYTELDAQQQQQVQDAIAAWVSDVEPLLAEPLLALYTSQLDETRISWAGSTTAEEESYLRIDGPRLWIEHKNASGDAGIHYHTIYRDKELDYGTGAQ